MNQLGRHAFHMAMGIDVRTRGTNIVDHAYANHKMDCIYFYDILQLEGGICGQNVSGRR